MFQTQQPDFIIREFSLSDFKSLKSVAARINQTAAIQADYLPFYAFQVAMYEPQAARQIAQKVCSFLQKAAGERQKSPRSTHRLAVCTPHGHLIGNVTIDMLPIQESDGRVVYGDLGYFIDPSAGGQGLMTKAVRHVLGIYFQTYQHLDITAHPNNSYSRRLIERLGGIQTGYLDKSDYQGEPRAVFVLTKDSFMQTMDKRMRLTQQSVLSPAVLAKKTHQNTGGI